MNDFLFGIAMGIFIQGIITLTILYYTDRI